MLLKQCSWCTQVSVSCNDSVQNLSQVYATLGLKNPHSGAIQESSICFKCYLCLKLVCWWRQRFLRTPIVVPNQPYDGAIFKLLDMQLHCPRCPICLDTQPSVEHVYQHLSSDKRRQTMSHDTDPEDQEKTSTVYRCSRDCGVAFTRKRLLYMHEDHCDFMANPVDLSQPSSPLAADDGLHSPEPTSAKKRPKVAKKKLCKICGKLATRLQRHILRHDLSANKFECAYCHKRYKSDQSLRIHQRKICEFHPNRKDDVVGRHECLMCPKVFTKRCSLDHHVKIHNKMPCPICKRSVAKSQMGGHMKYHEDAAVVCDKCGKTQKNPAALRAHQSRVHARRDRFACDGCELKFAFASALHRHQAVHVVGEKRYFCVMCGRGFLTATSMRLHIATTHEKTLRFECSQCNQVLSSKSSLRVHQRQHTGEKPYQCDICGHGFRQKPPLNRHRRSKHNIVEAPVETCTICGKTFARHSILMGHIVKMH